jgi:two-component system, OmpR family, KDP operon response regulator KdpE
MTRTRPLVLVIDDDPTLCATLVRELAAAGYDTASAGDGAAGAALFADSEPDLVITDLAMPVADGFAVVAAVRKAGRTPVIVLSVREGEEDKVRALDLGADDYVTKPFSLRELLARARTQLRRGRWEPPAEVLRFPGLVIDRGRRQVLRDGEEVRLTPTELAILELLAARAGRPVSLRQMIAVVWKGAVETNQETVRVHVGSLRRKLESDPSEPRFIATEPWVGYRFLPEPLDSPSSL